MIYPKRYELKQPFSFVYDFVAPDLGKGWTGWFSLGTFHAVVKGGGAAVIGRPYLTSEVILCHFYCVLFIARGY